MKCKECVLLNQRKPNLYVKRKNNEKIVKVRPSLYAKYAIVGTAALAINLSIPPGPSV